ncbi:FIST C-terminal domain-containing protein [Aquincola sp. S2]|uniref:FIST C-terminal domain-containing protein n=1 Tax=Pseudaquabacterium terrae TaxID=2732868 RepID=A0ABX2ELS7_9BURK|nr:FIST N-terminal domain-containing protein [Aquabacterium terrae]NRF69606.1 FIST C-terminal domain-containing protein [Aquabacterium terrae]
MRSKSASSTNPDPYRAALAIGESLAEIAPEVVFLHTTVHYSDWHEFIEGLYDGLGHRDVRLVGASGDGIHEAGRTVDVGAAALGLNSGGQVRWHVAFARGVKNDPEATVRAALATLADKLGGRTPALYYFISDFDTDASRIETVLRDEVSVPVVGGMAGDDNDRMDHCSLFADGERLDDAVVMLAAEGALDFRVHIGNSIRPVGRPGRVQAAEGKVVHRIDGVDATEFVTRESGKPFLRADQGIVTLAVLNTAGPGEKRLRAVAKDRGEAAGSLALHGGIHTDDDVQVCVSSPQDLLHEVQTLAAGAAADGFDPAAALVITCAGRKWLVGGNIRYEVDAVFGAFGRTLPLAGFASFGEIGPLRHDGQYTRNLFHNMTFVLLLIGSNGS